jgi:hypothetical protein
MAPDLRSKVPAFKLAVLMKKCLKPISGELLGDERPGRADPGITRTVE